VRSADKGESEGGTKFIIKYRPNVHDIAWAHNGVVATVCNGESIPLLQQ